MSKCFLMCERSARISNKILCSWRKVIQCIGKGEAGIVKYVLLYINATDQHSNPFAIVLEKYHTIMLTELSTMDLKITAVSISPWAVNAVHEKRDIVCCDMETVVNGLRDCTIDDNKDYELNNWHWLSIFVLMLIFININIFFHE